ncbi:hypothetical protein ACH5RR_013575 [Cinchona calisaya]|uniref:Reverse transcriptase RNase H-like domain-containing protein n=1 Tax=Cinchona calisaya TaxID=153742 RepID=A0ABD3A1U5_9GENT
MLAIVTVVQKWRLYLLGKHFVIKTDHQSLKYMMEQKISTPMQQKWIAKLLGYDYKLQYRKEIENVAADALCRRPHELGQLNAISVIRSALLTKIH